MAHGYLGEHFLVKRTPWINNVLLLLFVELTHHF